MSSPTRELILRILEYRERKRQAGEDVEDEKEGEPVEPLTSRGEHIGPDWRKMFRQSEKWKKRPRGIIPRDSEQDIMYSFLRVRTTGGPRELLKAYDELLANTLRTALPGSGRELVESLSEKPSFKERRYSNGYAGMGHKAQIGPLQFAIYIQL